MSGLQLPHRRQQLGGQQGHVVHHPLVLVTRPVAEITVPQERAYRLVMVRQVVQTVEVTAQALLENAQHQDLPQLHPRTPDRAVGLRHDMLVQQRKQTSAQLLVGPDVLKPLQHPGRSSPLTIRDTSRRIKQLRIFWPTLSTRSGQPHTDEARSPESRSLLIRS